MTEFTSSSEIHKNALTPQRAGVWDNTHTEYPIWSLTSDQIEIMFPYVTAVRKKNPSFCKFISDIECMQFNQINIVST
jgi:hypothetical protein